MSAAVEVCQGRPALCPRYEHDLIARWHGPCPIPATAIGNTPRTRGLRIRRAHAHRLVDRGGPDTVIRDASHRPASSSVLIATESAATT